VDNQNALPDLAKLFQDIPQVCLAYLFGSRAGGNVGPLSDYDFGVLLDHGAEIPPLRDELTHVLVTHLGIDRVDVVILNEAPIELAYAVIAQGVVLYQRDLATRVEYEATVMGLYGDYLPVLRQQRREILQGDDHAKRVQRYREALGRTQRTLSQITTPHTKDRRV
jgi:predicted nucleotidyltransferase